MSSIRGTHDLLSTESDACLWIAFREGNKEAFSALYKKCYPKLFTYGRYLGMDESQVFDAIQEIFLKIYEKPSLVTDESTILNFLFRSVRNYFINLTRKNNRYTDIENYITDFTFEYTIEEQFFANEDRAAITAKIAEVMSCLTSRQKEIIYFRFLHEMEYEEIAKIMAITQQAARNMIYKAFEKIRKAYPHYMLSFMQVVIYEIV